MFGYYSPLTVTSSSTLLPSTQTDFPVLISFTDTRLKTVANGGHVANSNGWDIRPYLTPYSSPSQKMDYELVFYDGVNGILEMWSRKPSMALGDVFYLFYDDPSIGSDDTSANTWDSNFVQVYHLPDGTTLSIKDSISGNNAVSSNVTPVAGQIDGGGSFDNSSQSQVAMNFTGTFSSFTMSCWAKPSTLGTNMGPLGAGSGGTGSVFMGASARPWTFDNAIATHDATTGQWDYLVGVQNGTSQLIYVNGVLDTTASPFSNSISGTFRVGVRSDVAGGSFFTGSIDEARLSKSVRAADWITAEYNNQLNPTTFLTLGTEQVIAAPKRSQFFFFLPPTTR